MKLSIEEFKELVTWATKNHVKKLRYDKIELELHDSALISQLTSDLDIKTEPLSTSKTLTDTEIQTQSEEEELLYWSSKG